MDLKLISERRNNKIFSDGNGNDYKIFNNGYSKNDVFLEASINARIESIGLNIPSVKEVTVIDDQWAFKLDHIEGQSLYKIMMNDTEHIEEYISKMIDVQTRIHGFKCPYIPVQKEKFTHYINKSLLDKSLKIDLLDMLNTSPKHNKLCHGNLTPHNIIITGDKYFITDWNHATQGNATADIARSYIWMKINMPEYADMYLEKFCTATNTSTRYVNHWLPIVAAARLSKNNPEEISILNNIISEMDYNFEY